jgi:hydrogenase 3 maturation protease
VSLKIILGIGNPLGSDDAVGPFVARIINEKLREKAASRQIMAIDADQSPESYTSVIRKNRPEQLILVDAADMALSPGSIRLLSPHKIKTVAFSTHQMPLSALVSYVQEFCGKIYVIGIQPERTEAGGRLSASVRKSGPRVAALILDDRLNEIEVLE